MQLVNERHLYKNKRNRQMVYLMDTSEGFAKLLTIKLNNAHVHDVFEDMPETVFFEEYEQVVHVASYQACIDYFEQMLRLKKLQEAIKNQQDSLRSFIEQNQNTLSRFEHTLSTPQRERTYHYQNEILSNKTALAQVMKISIGTLNRYIDKWGLDHYHLSEEDTEKIFRLAEQYRTQQNMYVYGKIQAKSVQRFLYLLDIPYTIYTKWKEETKHTREDLTKKEGVDSLIYFYKQSRI